MPSGPELGGSAAVVDLTLRPSAVFPAARQTSVLMPGRGTGATVTVTVDGRKCNNMRSKRADPCTVTVTIDKQLLKSQQRKDVRHPRPSRCPVTTLALWDGMVHRAVSSTSSETTVFMPRHRSRERPVRVPGGAGGAHEQLRRCRRQCRQTAGWVLRPQERSGAPVANHLTPFDPF